MPKSASGWVSVYMSLDRGDSLSAGADTFERQGPAEEVMPAFRKWLDVQIAKRTTVTAARSRRERKSK